MNRKISIVSGAILCAVLAGCQSDNMSSGPEKSALSGQQVTSLKELRKLDPTIPSIKEMVERVNATISEIATRDENIKRLQKKYITARSAVAEIRNGIKADPAYKAAGSAEQRKAVLNADPAYVEALENCNSAKAALYESCRAYDEFNTSLAKWHEYHQTYIVPFQ